MRLLPLEVRSEMLEVRNGFATFEQSRFFVRLQRGKRQEFAFIALRVVFKTRILLLASCKP